MSEKKILILYVLHKITESFKFFCRVGYLDDPKYQFIFIVNDPNLKIDFISRRNNVSVINRENIGYDIGAWSEILLSKSGDHLLYEEYDNFILMNSSAIGPFLPPWYDVKKNGSWAAIFLNKLNDTVKLVGATINNYIPETRAKIGGSGEYPHVQTMFCATDKIGMSIGIKSGVFSHKMKDKFDCIYDGEVKFSTEILKAGYNIACMLQYFKNVDFRNPVTNWHITTDHCLKNNYYGMNIHVYETIFLKGNRNIDDYAHHTYMVWHSNHKQLDDSYIDKITCGESEDKSIDITKEVKDLIHKYNVIENVGNIMIDIKKVKDFSDNSKVFIYTNKKYIPHIFKVFKGDLVPVPYFMSNY